MRTAMRSQCMCNVDRERRWFFTRGTTLLAGPLVFPAMPAEAAGPFLWFWRLAFGRTLAREQIRFLGGVAGQALRTAVAPAAARTGMSWTAGIGVASSATILAVGATQLAEIYSPAWFARLRGRIADYTISPTSSSDQRRVGVLHDDPWSEPTAANLMYGVRYIPADPSEEPPPVSVSHQRLVLPGERPGASVVELQAPAGRVYAPEPFVLDVDRQQLYIASGGGLPPPIVRFEWILLKNGDRDRSRGVAWLAFRKTAARREASVTCPRSPSRSASGLVAARASAASPSVVDFEPLRRARTHLLRRTSLANEADRASRCA